MDKYINKSGGGERGKEEEWAHQVEEVMRWRVGWVCRRGEEEGSGAHHQLCVRVNKECVCGGAGGSEITTEPQICGFLLRPRRGKR